MNFSLLFLKFMVFMTHNFPSLEVFFLLLVRVLVLPHLLTSSSLSFVVSSVAKLLLPEPQPRQRRKRLRQKRETWPFPPDKFIIFLFLFAYVLTFQLGDLSMISFPWVGIFTSRPKMAISLVPTPSAFQSIISTEEEAKREVWRISALSFTLNT